MIRKYKKLDYNTEELESLSSSDLKKVADYSLREYLLRVHMRDDGLYRCPLKKQWYQKNKIHVAHYMDRGNMWTRYDLQNCHLISEQSNMWESQEPKEGYKSLHHYDYEQFLVLEYGEDIIKILRKKAKNKEIFKKENYIEIINKFRINE